MGKIEIAEREVTVWPLLLTATDAVVARFGEILADDEAARAARFRFDHLRRSYSFARGGLRILLGRYLGIPPDHVPLKYGPKGKPAFDGPGRIRFNLTHSGDVALFAFTLDGEIGVDVEQIRPVRDIPGIANRYFCAEETAELMALPPDEQCHAFFSCWTRKEAYIKALGEGLYVPLDSFRVTFLPGTPPRLTLFGPPGSRNDCWTLHNIDFLPGYVAALAYADPERSLRVMRTVTPDELWQSLP